MPPASGRRRRRRRRRTVDPPQPRAWVTGRGAGLGQLQSRRLLLPVLTTPELPGGQLHASTACENGDAVRRRRDAGTIPANGSVQLGCYYGGYNSSYALWVGSSGWGDSEPTRWD